MSEAQEKPQMCSEFQEIFKKYRPGIDFIVLGEIEHYQGRDEYGHPNGKIEAYDLKGVFEKKPSMDSRGNLYKYACERNCGVTAAYDFATKTYICTARPDIIEPNGAGLECPFRRDLGRLPADPGKCAAFKYQEKVDEMLTAEKEAKKANASLSNLIRNALQARR